MDEREKAKEYLSRFLSNKPRGFFDKMDASAHGMRMILHMLACGEGKAQAGDIAAALHASTPRVAAALNALEKHGFVTRACAEDDRRKKIVTLTDKGRAEIARCDAEAESVVAYLLREVGERDMNELIRITARIGEAMEARFDANGDGREHV